jgi:DNA polymerase III delta subunit
MLYVFFGTDVVTVREKARARARALGEENVASVTVSDYHPGILQEHAGSVSLFGSKAVTLIDTLSEDVDIFSSLIEDLPMLAQADHAFVVIEQALLAEDKKTFKRYAAEYTECVAEKRERFNTFKLADTLLERDKRSLWLLLMEAFRTGVSPEEVAGLFFWQIKTLRLVARTSSAEEAGVKPFVYTKAKRGLGRFKPEELDRFSRELVTLYHEGHRGIRDMGLALEQWVLSL